MNRDLGFYTVKPDQMIVLKPLFELITLPMCDYLIYPLLAKIRVRTLLQKMTIGGMMAVVAFAIAGFIEVEIQTNFLSIFWLVPQYLIMAFSENFLFPSHLNFAYTEAPERMKSVMTSFVFVVMAFGNLLIAIINGTKLFESQAVEFFSFAGVLFVFMIIFGYLAWRYQPVNKAEIRE